MEINACYRKGKTRQRLKHTQWKKDTRHGAFLAVLPSAKGKGGEREKGENLGRVFISATRYLAPEMQKAALHPRVLCRARECDGEFSNGWAGGQSFITFRSHTTQE